MKQCSNIKCLQKNPQPFDRFFVDKNSKDGYCYECKSCRRAYTSRYRKENTTKVKLSDKNQNLMKTYGITLKQYDELLAKQNYKCDICGVHQELARTKRSCSRSFACRGI